MQNLL